METLIEDTFWKARIVGGEGAGVGVMGVLMGLDGMRGGHGKLVGLRGKRVNL